MKEKAKEILKVIFTLAITLPMFTFVLWAWFGEYTDDCPMSFDIFVLTKLLAILLTIPLCYGWYVAYQSGLFTKYLDRLTNVEDN